MKSRIQIYSQRFALASFAAVAVTACQVPDGSGLGGSPITSPSYTPAQLNAVCDPFGSSGGSTPGGPLNGLLASLSYLPNGNTHEYTGVMDFEKKATPVSYADLSFATLRAHRILQRRFRNRKRNVSFR